MTRLDFNDCMEKLCHSFDKKLSDERKEEYWKNFNGMTAFYFWEAVNWAVHICSAFPSIAELLRGVNATGPGGEQKKHCCQDCGGIKFEGQMTVTWDWDGDPASFDGPHNYYHVCDDCFLRRFQKDFPDVAKARHLNTVIDQIGHTIGKRDSE